MAIQKQAIPINFSSGLDTKTDPKQVQPGKFLSLQNTVFDKGGLLQKRNGYGSLPTLPDASNTFATTFNGDLTAIGTSLSALSLGSSSWVNKGPIQPVALSTMPLIRSSTPQTQADSAVSSNGLICTVYTDSVPVAGTPTPEYKYVVADAATGQNIVASALIPVTSGAVTGSPRVFTLGNHFVIVFTNLISATYHLQYVAINVYHPTTITTNVNISSLYTPASTVAFDGVVNNNNLYLSWNGSDNAVRMTYIDSTLAQHNTIVYSGKVATMFTLTVDNSGVTPIIYNSFYDSGSSTGYTLAVNQLMNPVLAPTQIISSGSFQNLASTAQAGVCSVYLDAIGSYSYDGSIRTDAIQLVTVTQAGSVAAPRNLVLSLGLASKAFLLNGAPYMLAAYSSPYQPTYFLINGMGETIAKLAYANGGGYVMTGLPGVAITGTVAQIAYLFKDKVVAVNKSVGVANSTGIYSQTGINIASFDLGAVPIQSSEIGSALNITGGLVWSYDGYSPVEQGFNLWPDYVEVSTSASGGSISAQQYFYQAVYSWTDNQGNTIRSAPSIPVSVTTTGAASSNTINIPTLRVTYKNASPVKIEIYRWSTGQQIFYEVTSIANPLLNNGATNSVSFVDTLNDTAIVGNTIIYTAGGVIENIGPPATNIMALFQSRLWLVDAEDKNLLWFSKQVIEATPVEMSDLLTVYVAPTSGAQGSTGVITALSAMDDKLIIFKENAIYYVNGVGPDNTGANSQFSDPVFITSTVGCANPASIVFMPQGLMFQSDKGIWLLGRDLSSTYIGAPVENFTSDATAQSAVNVPATNQVRFTMSSGTTLMYDYYYGQWGTFVGVPAVSSTIFQGLHTYINSFGQTYQETPNLYLDGGRPVLISFTTGWMNLAGLQGYERAYFFYILATYYTPHKLAVSIAYDYNDSPSQQVTITPDNYSGIWGSEQLWGSDSPWGGPGNLEQWRVFFSQQKTQAFRITVAESFDPSHATVPGAGLSISGLNLVVGLKKGYSPIRAARSTG